MVRGGARPRSVDRCLLLFWLQQPGFPCENAGGTPALPVVCGRGRARFPTLVVLTPRACASGLNRQKTENPGKPAFVRGDCNGDGEVNVSDAIYGLQWIFAGGPEPGCVAAANVDGAGDIDLTDPIHLLLHLFAGGPAPVAPFPECGPGTLPADDATCEEAPGDCQTVASPLGLGDLPGAPPPLSSGVEPRRRTKERASAFGIWRVIWRKLWRAAGAYDYSNCLEPTPCLGSPFALRTVTMG